MDLKSLYKNNRLFFLGYFLFVVVSIFILLVYTKKDGFYLLNAYHSGILTYFFIYATYIGDGFFCIALGILLFLLRRRLLSFMVLSSYAISGAIAQVLKYFILEPRPAILLKETNYQYFIDDVTLHNLHAFPSGHTASAFALAAVLSFATKNKNYSIMFLAGAILVGYSRIYLAQHFMDDVLGGAVIGVGSAIICQVFFEKYSGSKFFK
ncbi:MAG TPA: phosphatase PAP2 family protein [Chitinophagaceae bacterium]|nr:phosphatase PAP2 family protein [Chitinophagaceae bacterium]